LILEKTAGVAEHFVNAHAEHTERDEAQTNSENAIGLLTSFLPGNCPFARGPSDRRIASRRSLRAGERREKRKAQ
jgi:hypothetical protein